MNYHINRGLRAAGIVFLGAVIGATNGMAVPGEVLAIQPCTAGDAGGYACSNVDLLAHLPLSQIGGGKGADIWGWTDSTTGKEYAIVGRNDGTSFVDISVPESPVYLGNLPPPGAASPFWRDIKVYQNYAYIVTVVGGAGMQIFDLNQLATVANPPVVFTAPTYTGFGAAHNVVINEDSGFAYAVGLAGNCNSGMHMMDISNPTSPVFVGCLGQDGEVHDAQCVIYGGPDTQHTGKELCFVGNISAAQSGLSIYDVSNKSTPIRLSQVTYPDLNYPHQGWLTEDHRYFLLGDEGDEMSTGGNTRTLIWDVLDVDLPVLIGEYFGAQGFIDHNQYVKGNYLYQANYSGGLRILDLTDVANGNLQEVAFFDSYPANDNTNYDGAWSVYPYYDSGIVTISDQNNGLFIVSPNLGGPPPEIVLLDGFEGL